MDDERALIWTKIVIMMFVLLPGGILLNGYVGMTLWNWFAVPLLDLPEISFFSAIVLGFMLSYYNTRLQYNEDRAPFGLIASFVFFRPLFFLFIGFILKQFM